MNKVNSEKKTQRRAVAGTCPTCKMAIMGREDDIQNHLRECGEKQIARYIENVVETASREVRECLLQYD